MIKTVGRRVIPETLKDRKNEILGEIKGITMPDCVYNAVIAGEIEPDKPLENISLPSFLKDYQLEDLKRSLGKSCVFNINKPGYGKTLETILWIKLNLQKDFKALILCPKSVISTWEDQLTEYWPSWASDGFWWITNYEQLLNETRFKLACEFFWDVIVLDESHTIKSMKSKITNVCFQLKSRARHCLTGTPVKNRPEDIASQLKWLDPYSITNYTDFKFAFCDMQKDKWGYKSCGLTKNKTMVENLQKLLNLYCIGGQEHNIGLREEPVYIKVKLKLDPAVKKLYQEIVGEYNKETKQRVINTELLLEKGIKVSNPIEAATRRQQLTSNCQLFDDKLKNVKFEWVLNWIKGTDEKVVIFSKYAETIKYLENYLIQNKVDVVTIKKEQSATVRKNMLNNWKKRHQVLLGTFGVLGTGTDGMQEVCHYVIFIDREWTASDNEQAEKRIVRTGQKHQVFIYILQAIGTIDIQIERVQLDKGMDAKMLLEPIIE